MTKLHLLSRLHSLCIFVALSAAPFFAIAAPVAAPAEILGAVGGEKPLGATEPELGKILRLKGSRGEVLNFIVRVSSPDCFRIDGPGFKEKGAKGKGLAVRWFRMPTVLIEKPSFPKAVQGRMVDPLIPYDPKGQVKICAEKGAKTTWIWGELEIAPSIAAGQYKSEIKTSLGVSMPIEVDVWKMKIPERPAMPAYGGLSSWTLMLGHYGKWREGEAELNAVYAAEMLRHRMVPIQNWIVRPPLVAGKKGEKPRLDLKTQPTVAQSFSSVMLQKRPEWAAFDFPTVEPGDISKPSTLEYFRAVENSLKETKRPGKAFVYLWDEPKPEVFPELRKLAKLVKENASHLKVLVTTPPKPELNDFVDIYVPVMDQFGVPGFPSADAYAKLRAKGGETWWYISCMSHGCDALQDSGRPDFTIERPAAWVRSIAWISMKFSIDAFLYYAVAEGYRNPKRDPWKSLWDFSGNGDGTLFYPGRVGENGFTRDVAVPTVRLKLWRESSFDAEYIRWMQERKVKPDWWEKEWAGMVRGTADWEKDYRKYQKLRDRMGEYLSKEMK